MRSIAYIVVAMFIVLAFTASVFATEGEDAKAGEKPVAVEAKAKKEETPVENPMVVFQTNHGDIKLELFQKDAPLSVKNFMGYIGDGFYDGTTFHRVVKRFVLQAGGINKDMDQKKQKAPIKNEATNGLKNTRGTLSMARTSDIGSGTSHFFINLADNKPLDHTGMEPAKYGYAVFGKVADDASMKVVDKIAQVTVTTKGHFQNVPAEPVMIKKAYIVGETKAKEETKEKTKEETKEETRKETKKELKKVQKQMKED